MSENEEQVLEVIKAAVPKMSERQKGYMLGYGTAMNELTRARELEEKKKAAEEKAAV